MGSTYTWEEFALIREAFNHGKYVGLLESIVRAGHERERTVLVNIPELLRTYAALEALNVVRLIKLLSSSREHIPDEIGFSSIDFMGVMDGPLTAEATQNLCALYIGNPRKGIGPLEWLTYLSRGFSRLLPIQARAFDEVCGDFALFLEKIRDGDYEAVDIDDDNHP